MTNKQKQILSVATKLFAKEGFDATSTSKIAKGASVSEGLIFRHFKSKQGLLAAIAKDYDDLAQGRMAELESQEGPGEVIQKAIAQAFESKKKDAPFHAISLQIEATGNRFGASREKQALEEILKKAFTKLNFEDPTTEARFLAHALNGISMAAYNGDLKGASKLKAFVQNMYL